MSGCQCRGKVAASVSTEIELGGGGIYRRQGETLG